MPLFAEKAANNIQQTKREFSNYVRNIFSSVPTTDPFVCHFSASASSSPSLELSSILLHFSSHEMEEKLSWVSFNLQSIVESSSVGKLRRQILRTLANCPRMLVTSRSNESPLNSFRNVCRAPRQLIFALINSASRGRRRLIIMILLQCDAKSKSSITHRQWEPASSTEHEFLSRSFPEILIKINNMLKVSSKTLVRLKSHYHF